MRLAIMQPYLFPYLGYFQLMAAVDRFVVYDDVNFIKQGWINRNRILVNGAPHTFTLPLKGAGSFVPIDRIAIDEGAYAHWRDRFLRTLQQAYGKAPFFAPAMGVVQGALEGTPRDLKHLLLDTLLATRAYLGIANDLVSGSRAYGNQTLSGQARVIDICRIEGADRYINAIGGRELYDAAEFARHGVALSFLRGHLDPYAQPGGVFHPGLSIIDVMMWSPPERIATMLQRYELE